MCDVVNLEEITTDAYSGCADEKGNLNPTAFAPKSAVQGSATDIIGAFDSSIAGQ